ncbi:MAG: histidine kinase [Flammeovirgaceae bacterium]|nr:histidine kinase [Flammeovirgaceae bacterium]
MEELQSSIVLVIVLGTIGMLLLIAGMSLFIVLYQKRMLKEKKKQAERELEYQSQMIQMQLESQEQERKRIGADLHDSLGSLLWGAKVNASFLQRSIELKNSALDSYTELNYILDESINTVRRIAWDLTPDAFLYAGLSESVRKLCNQFDGKGIKIVFNEEGAEHWNDDRALQVFRIVQELVSNSLKHSQANLLHVSLSWQSGNLEVKLNDNGVGFKPDAGRNGVGLWNVEQRARQLQAKIHIGNPPICSGTEIVLQIPLHHDKE